jgi:diguanylate cyclase (GGDEF)-like protein
MTDTLFPSAYEKRTILIADDYEMNREILGDIFEDVYDIVFAQDGAQALDIIREMKEKISLVLLDLMMPKMSGIDVLKCLRAEPALNHIPVIVMTADQAAEVECLSLGAIDFIPKPYPSFEVILARVKRTIEMFEDREVIRVTQRDPLTGLYNREYFYLYADQIDQRRSDVEMDAILLNINHFRMINERYGKVWADGVLRLIGKELDAIVSNLAGICCRREADTFLAYCPHGADVHMIFDRIASAIEEKCGNRVHLRMGVYENADKSLEIERRFDRAKSAADTVRNSFTRTIGFYDDELHEKELFSEQLIEDFPAAIAEGQFKVFYQPKYDIRPDVPVLSSAEALVRWSHPTLGLINPGIFIPLFEENGLIQELDHYVWRTAAAQIRDWKERLGILFPVSVNVSRVDMYDSMLNEHFRAILKEYGLSAQEFRLEITESAYTQDSKQIINMVNSLRDSGFRIEMDDFGTGYSSLNMISSLPIDVLKLDMQFIRNAFRDEKEIRLIEIIIDIADYLNVPTIAEGVETREQLQALRKMGCDYVQGYYFSKPVPAEEFEQFFKKC